MSFLVPLVLLIPLIGAAVNLMNSRRRRTQTVVTLTALGATLAVSCLLLWQAASGSILVMWVGGWAPPHGIPLVVDRLSAVLLVITSVVLLAVYVFSIGQRVGDGDAQPAGVSVFNPTFLILGAGVNDAFIAGDLFNLYVAFEILLIASYVLLTLGGTQARIRAGVTYIIVSLVSSVLFLSAIAFIYAATGTVTIAQLAERVAELPGTTQAVLHVVLITAFGIKAAVFPLAFWLPDSYPSAPAPVTAVFAGLLTKVGVYAILRAETLIFPVDNINTVLLWVALLTMIVGILGAVAQANIKRILSFTLISHIGYMIFGIAVASPASYTATIFYIVHHILVQTTLFLVTGLIEREKGTASIRRLAGIATASPLLAILYFIPALNLGGIPPFSGFLGKLALFDAGVRDGQWTMYVVIVAGIVTSLLTLYALMRVWNAAFMRTEREREAEEHQPDARAAAAQALFEEDEDATISERRRNPRLMIGATIAMVVASTSLTLFAGPLFDFAADASRLQTDPQIYIDAVMHEGAQTADDGSER